MQPKSGSRTEDLHVSRAVSPTEMTLNLSQTVFFFHRTGNCKVLTYPPPPTTYPKWRGDDDVWQQWILQLPTPLLHPAHVTWGGTFCVSFFSVNKDHETLSARGVCRPYWGGKPKDSVRSSPLHSACEQAGPSLPDSSSGFICGFSHIWRWTFQVGAWGKDFKCAR